MSHNCTIVAQAANANVRSVRPNALVSGVIRKVATMLSVISGAAPLLNCEGPLVAQSGHSVAIILFRPAVLRRRPINEPSTTKPPFTGHPEGVAYGRSFLAGEK